MPTASQFKSLIEQQNLTQRFVAREIGLSYEYLNSYLNGHQNYLQKSKYYRLCQLLGVDVLF